MASHDPAVLSLRLRARATTSHAPDVAAFRRAPRSRSAQRPRSEPIGVLPGAGPQTPDGPLLVFFQRSDFGIPAPAPGQEHGQEQEQEQERRVPDPAHWSVRSTAIGWVAAVPRAAQPGRSSAARVIVGCLTLAIPFATASASEPGPELQRPTVEAREGATQPSPPTLPQEPWGADPTPPTLPAPPASVDPLTTPPPPPSTAATARAQSSATLDAAWEGIDGFRVVLELKGGMTLEGRVGAVQRDTFTLIQAETGKVLVLPKSGVSSLRAHVPPKLPTKNGMGLIIGGGVLTAIGTPLFISGAIFVGICPSCTYIHLPLLILGAGALGGGIPMIVQGRRRRAIFNNAIKEHNLAPTFARTRYGWTGGLRFRF